MNMNKTVVALVVSMLMLGLVGVASAGYFTHTDVAATHFTSKSQLIVSGYVPISSAYSQALVAKLVPPAFPPLDIALSDTIIEGKKYAHTTESSSTPTGSVVSTTIENPNSVSGSTSFWNCALWGTGMPSQTITFPQEAVSGTLTWKSTHPTGSAYPAHSIETHNIYRP